MIKAFRKVLGRHSDIGLVVAVMAVLTVLFAPIPAPMQDLLIIMNISFALLLLLLTFYTPKPADFSTFPSLLLIATLFRLALNVAATRLILSDADAGQVIAAVGAYVVGGNYIIGMIVFLILVVVQYVVVTSGAQRVSEVAARFTLDSMPGQQMSIDADLNMGLIDQDEAKRRRKVLEKEAGFYGAMDGASKFVKGDAVAGIIIMLINIVGGLTIGVMQMGMTWGQALHTFTLLTVGDGIVTQIPALVIAVGTGIIVTRSSSDEQLSTSALKQITAFPKTIFLVVAALGIVLFLPGIPAWPVLLVMAFMSVVGYWSLKGPDLDDTVSQEKDAVSKDGPAGDDAMVLPPIEVLLGPALATSIGTDQERLLERIAAFRQELALEFGVLVPKVAFRPANRLNDLDYEIQVYGVGCGRGELRPDLTLAIHPRGDTTSVKGIQTREPSYGLPAVWIEDSEKEAARLAKFTLVDPTAVFITHLSETIKTQTPALLTRAEVDRLLARIRQTNPGLVEELVPTILTVGDVQKVLQQLLREKVSIRNLEAIVEVLADTGRFQKDTGSLVDAVRQRLGAAICQSLLGDAKAMQVITLQAQVEQALLSSIKAVGADSRIVIDPQYAEQLLHKLVKQAELMVGSDLLPILLCAPELRRHVWSLIERVLPHMRVLSLAEVPNTVGLKSFAVVEI